MNRFSISQLQRFSGVSVHTIRAWEKRYGALKPGRSKGNTRYYDGLQLKRLLNIAGLMNYNYKISELCAMPDSQLNDLLNTTFIYGPEDRSPAELLMSQIIAAAVGFNESLFDRTFSHAVTRFGLKETYLQVIYPALTRLGMMWSVDKIAPGQEHFVTNLMRQKLSTSIDGLPLNESAKKTWLLFLPENEFHEIGLLMANYVLRQRGHKVIYLGANVPFESLVNSVKAIKPDCLLFFFVSKNTHKMDALFIKELRHAFDSVKIFPAANTERLVKFSGVKNVTPISSVQELEKAL